MSWSKAPHTHRREKPSCHDSFKRSPTFDSVDTKQESPWTTSSNFEEGPLYRAATAVASTAVQKTFHNLSRFFCLKFFQKKLDAWALSWPRSCRDSQLCIALGLSFRPPILFQKSFDHIKYRISDKNEQTCIWCKRCCGWIQPKRRANFR